MKHKTFIDSHKGATGLFVLGCIAYYRDWSDLRAWLYLAMHGTYGILWIIKSHYFGDRQWERPISISYGLTTWFGLSLYWVSPWLICSHRTAIPPAWYLGLCVFIFTIGIFLHFVTDMQKHMSLQLRPGVLITEGLWGSVRNPNYLGELLVYLGFSMVAYHWAPLAALALIIVAVWIPNMLRKDKSLSRYPEFAAYRARSNLFIPYIW